MSDEMRKRNTDLALMTILVKGIKAWRNHIPFNVTNLEPCHRELVQEQDNTGWRQIFNGRWSTKWAQLQERHDKETGSCNPNWEKQTLTLIWNHWEKVWKIRNDIQHGENPEDEVKMRTENAKAELKSIHDNRKLYKWHQIRNTCVRHMNSMKLHQIKNWLQYYRGLFKHSMKEVKKKSIANTKSMQKHFVTTHEAAKKRKQTQRSRRRNKRQKLFKSVRRTTTLRLQKYFSAHVTNHRERNLEANAIT